MPEAPLDPPSDHTGQIQRIKSNTKQVIGSRCMYQAPKTSGSQVQTSSVSLRRQQAHSADAHADLRAAQDHLSLVLEKDAEIERLKAQNLELQNGLRFKSRALEEDATAAREVAPVLRNGVSSEEVVQTKTSDHKTNSFDTSNFPRSASVGLIAKRDRRSAIQLAVAVLLVAPFLFVQNKPIDSIDTTSDYAPNKKLSSVSKLELASSFSLETTEQTDVLNSIQVKEWRDQLDKQCTNATSIEDIESVISQVKKSFTFPNKSHKQPRNDHSLIQPIKRCKNVILDFGANIGDTAGHAIDAGLYTCHRKDLQSQPTELRINITSGSINEGTTNPLTKGLQHIMNEYSFGPEDYCYYGIEGNPVFTERLQDLEDMVMNMHPRPLKHLHFYTESVGAGHVGITTLYLDTVNTKQNFWGSSIFKDHGDVRTSASKNNSTLVEANVMGYTISELLSRIMQQFTPETVSEDDRRGGHLVVKIDIEGGEWPLLLEAASNGTLCYLAEMGTRVDMFVEFHSEAVIGKNPLRFKMPSALEKLESCGVLFRKLDSWWA